MEDRVADLLYHDDTFGSGCNSMLGIHQFREYVSR